MGLSILVQELIMLGFLYCCTAHYFEITYVLVVSCYGSIIWISGCEIRSVELVTWNVEVK